MFLWIGIQMHSPLIASLLLVLAAGLNAQNCSGTSVGLVPLNDLGSGTYLGFQGGLYPGGVNVPPPAHLASGLLEAGAITPLDEFGVPSPSGKVVLMSIGMSNATIEFSSWMAFNDVESMRNPQLVVVDAARNGFDLDRMKNASDIFYSTTIPSRLAARHATLAQVQAVWLKPSHANPFLSFPLQQTQYRDDLRDTVRILKSMMPNLRLCYISSRIYAGYSTVSLSPESYAYETGFGVKWLIEDQINGDPLLNFDPAQGTVEAPWLAWGPYLWADGVNPRSDGLTYLCSDYRLDGTHPGVGASLKVRDLLEQHFTTDPTATSWFNGSGGEPIGGNLAQAVFYGNSSGCNGGGGEPRISVNSSPFLGNTNFGVRVDNVYPQTSCYFVMSLAPDLVDIGNFCGLQVSIRPEDMIAPSATYDTGLVTGNGGGGILKFSVPNDPQLDGQRLFGEWVIFDLTGQAQILTTRAVELIIGMP